jgi:type II secretory pathway pseudopilin PulG
MRIKLKQGGVTLLEVLAVIIISILLSIGAFSLYTSSQDKKQEQDTITAITTLRLLIQDSYSGSGGYEGLDNSTLIQRVQVPSSLTVINGEIRFPLGGQLSVSGNQYGFSISLSELSVEHCVSLGNRRALSSHIVTGNDSVNPNPSEVTDYCSNAGQGGEVSFISTNNINNFLSGSTSSE